MKEITTLNDLVTSIGIPALFFLLLAYALLKLIPKWIDVWQEHKGAELRRETKASEEMQTYYNERNKSYQQQLEVMNLQAEQQNQLVGQATEVMHRSNIVIEANTKAIEKNVEIHDKVIAALQTDLEATREMTRQLQAHDERAQKIYTTALRVSDRIDLAVGKQ